MAVFHFLFQIIRTTQFWILLCTLLVLVKFLSRRKYKLPPRPMSWPLVGNFFSIPKDVLLHHWCMKVAEVHGPVFRLSMGLFDAVVINDIENLEDAYMEKSMDFAGRASRIMFQALTGDNQEVAGGNPTDRKWSVKRKLFANSVRAFTSGRRNEVRILEAFDVTRTELDEKAESGKAFDPNEFCSLLLCNNLGNICFKRSFSTDDEDLHTILSLVHTVNTAMSSAPTITELIPLLTFLPFDMPDMKYCRKVAAPVHRFLEKELENSRKIYSKDSVETLTHHMLKMIEESDDDDEMKELSDREIALLLLDVFLAGLDTSNVTLRWILNILAVHQDIQQKLYDEIDHNIGSNTIQISQHKHLMPYSEAILLEALRYTTIIPLSLPRKTLVDTKVGEYDVPAGTMVIANAYAIHHDKRITDSDKFMPERFLTAKGEISARPRCFVPFGLGRRSCPGESAARSLIWSLMTMMVQRYKILPPKGKELTCQFNDNFFIAEPSPYQIRLEFRD